MKEKLINQHTIKTKVSKNLKKDFVKKNVEKISEIKKPKVEENSKFTRSKSHNTLHSSNRKSAKKEPKYMNNVWN